MTQIRKSKQQGLIRNRFYSNDSAEISDEEILRFPLGDIEETKGAFAHVKFLDMMNALFRHSTGDWGDLAWFNKKQNDDALTHGFGLLSCYRTQSGVVFLVITARDHSQTTILLPTEY